MFFFFLIKIMVYQQTVLLYTFLEIIMYDINVVLIQYTNISLCINKKIKNKYQNI